MFHCKYLFSVKMIFCAKERYLLTTDQDSFENDKKFLIVFTSQDALPPDPKSNDSFSFRRFHLGTTPKNAMPISSVKNPPSIVTCSCV